MPPYEPRVSVIVPCPSEVPGVERAAIALARQDYPWHEVLFVLEDPQATVYAPLERVRQAHPQVRLVLADAGIVGTWPSRTVVAQLTGIRHAEARSEVLAFADPWARPGPGWLARLVAPLEDPEVAAATGLREDRRGLVGCGLAARRSRFGQGPIPGRGLLGQEMFGLGLVCATGPVVAVHEAPPEAPAAPFAIPFATRGAPTSEWG